MYKKTGRYSFLIRPIIVVLDLLTINITGSYFINLKNNETLLFHIYTSVLWLVLAYIYKYYNVYRFTSPLKILSLILKQSVSFTLVLFAFWGIFRIDYIGKTTTLLFIIYAFAIITFIKFLVYYALKQYRSYLGGNERNVVIIGNTQTNQLQQFFKKRKDLGYKLKGVFNNTQQHLTNCLSLIINGKVDEVYCAAESLSNEQLNEFVKVSEENNITLKFIPSRSSIYGQKMQVDYYEYFPVMSFQEVALNNPINQILKRIFDIVFSVFVILFVLSWLTPLLAILIKLESKGPVFFKHIRNGINYKEFVCYKFRSLKETQPLDLNQVKANDHRFTRIGKFIRKTSIDELPQFFNVFIGNMSVVGPRPHMLQYTKEYAKKIDKYSYIFRHSVKPGISGLAQINGYRGETKYDADIIGRIKYDIFYIENWSLLLDIKIILQTLANIIKGEEKAY